MPQIENAPKTNDQNFIQFKHEDPKLKQNEEALKEVEKRVIAKVAGSNKNLIFQNIFLLLKSGSEAEVKDEQFINIIQTDPRFIIRSKKDGGYVVKFDIENKPTQEIDNIEDVTKLDFSGLDLSAEDQEALNKSLARFAELKAELELLEIKESELITLSNKIQPAPEKVEIVESENFKADVEIRKDKFNHLVDETVVRFLSTKLDADKFEYEGSQVSSIDGGLRVEMHLKGPFLYGKAKFVFDIESVSGTLITSNKKFEREGLGKLLKKEEPDFYMVDHFPESMKSCLEEKYPKEEYEREHGIGSWDKDKWEPKIDRKYFEPKKIERIDIKDGVIKVTFSKE